MEFKVGDKVRCIDDDKNNLLTIDKIYTVIEDRGDYINIKDDNNYYNSFFCWRFEKVEETEEVTYEVIKPFNILTLWDKYKDNHSCNEFQKAWGMLLFDLMHMDWKLKKLITEFKKNDIPATLWEYRDKLEEKGLIKKIEKEIVLYPGMKLKDTYTKFTYRIINCSELSSNMTYFNILVEENNFCYDFGKIFSCSTLEELNEITGEIFEVINEKE